MSALRRHTWTDRSLAVLDTARFRDPSTTLARANPAGSLTSAPVQALDQRLVAGLMRINHSGEVCAQALYLGQAAVAESQATREHLLQAAAEEHDHLVWCAARLAEVGARESVFNPAWFVGSYLIGAGAAMFGDKISLGFVVETERQVETHLDDHLERLPSADARSRAILATMQREEVEHGQHALERGGVELPQPVKRLMGWCADAMRFVTYRV